MISGPPNHSQSLIIQQTYLITLTIYNCGYFRSSSETTLGWDLSQPGLKTLNTIKSRRKL